MLIRVTRQPYGFADGISLRRYQPGRTYELDPAIAEYLVLQGFARFEMRRLQRSSRARPNDRRQATFDELS